MMFDLSVEGHFSAAHQVEGYPGDCASIHGHTYQVKVVFGTKTLNNIGLAIDFRHLKTALEQILAELDHKNLNNLAYFKEHNATAEYVAMYIFNEMKKEINIVKAVTVWEGHNTSVTYYET
jgi:6-pyruvoyltetrahydropterin/6-carboxytetrahydropterin synthase